MKPGVLATVLSSSRLRAFHAGTARHGGMMGGPFWASDVELGETVLVLEVVPALQGGSVDVRVLGPRGPGWIWSDELGAA